MANFAQNFIAGQQMGRERRLQDEALAKQSQLGRLVGESLTAPVTARDSYLGQIAGLDPNAALTLSTRFQGEAQAQREAEQARVQNMARLFAVAPAQSRATMWGQIRPALQGMGFEAPEAWDEGLLPVVQQLGGAGQDGAQSAQRAYVEWMASQIPEAERGEFFRVQAGLAPKAQNQRYNVQRTELDTGEVRYDRIPTIGGNVAGGMGGGAATPALPFRVNLQGLQPESIAAARQQIEADIGRSLTDSEWTQISGQRTSVTPSEMDRRANSTLDAQTYGPRAGQATNASRAAAAAEAAAARVRAEELAKREVQQINDAPGAVRNAEMMLGNIDAVLQHPDLETVTGFSGLADPRNWPGINRGFGTSDVMARIEQLQGASFLEAFEKLKGGGAITEAEGKKAEQAQARLTTAQNDEAFRTALEDLRDAIAPALERARARIQGGEEPTVVRTGTTSDGRRVRQMSDGRILDESGQEVR